MNLLLFLSSNNFCTNTCKCRFSCIPVSIDTRLAPPGQGMVKDVVVEQACRVNHFAHQGYLPLFCLHLKVVDLKPFEWKVAYFLKGLDTRKGPGPWSPKKDRVLQMGHDFADFYLRICSSSSCFQCCHAKANSYHRSDSFPRAIKVIPEDKITQLSRPRNVLLSAFIRSFRSSHS